MEECVMQSVELRPLFVIHRAGMPAFRKFKEMDRLLQFGKTVGHAAGMGRMHPVVRSRGQEE